MAKLLRDTPERRRSEIGAAARARVLSEHTAERRAAQLEAFHAQAALRSAGAARAGRSREAPSLVLE
jgi:hypothetical protein